ncbi:MAG: DUF354 domain-containing protein [Chloroflexota bacterium]
MRILLDIHHPKQVHFFRPLIHRWQECGDVVQIVSRDKDITHHLLELYGMPYVSLSRQQTGWRSSIELVQRWIRFAGWVRRFRPDIVLSVAGITSAPPSRLLGVPNIALTDTETATLSNRISFPFADRILTPEWFNRDFGSRHFRYRGFHEWGYLNPATFQPNAKLLQAEGINPDEPYAIVRLVRWGAAHDRSQYGLTAREALILVKSLSNRMRVYLSCESLPPEELRPYLLKANVDKIHHLLAFSRLTVGESPSMGTEACLLGVPAILISSWAGQCGNMQVLQKFGLMQVYPRGEDGIQAALRLADHPPPKEEWDFKRETLTRDLESIPEMLDKHIRILVGHRYG